MSNYVTLAGSDALGVISIGGSLLTTGTLYLDSTVPSTCAIGIDTLRQIRILLRCIQQHGHLVNDGDLVTMVQSAVGYCGEKAAEIEALLPAHGMLEDGE